MPDCVGHTYSSAPELESSKGARSAYGRQETGLSNDEREGKTVNNIKMTSI